MDIISGTFYLAVDWLPEMVDCVRVGCCLLCLFIVAGLSENLEFDNLGKKKTEIEMFKKNSLKNLDFVQTVSTCKVIKFSLTQKICHTDNKLLL